MSRHKIVCRARLVDECYHDGPTMREFGEDLPMNEDGTFDGRSIICDPCYLAIQPFTRVDRDTGREKLSEAVDVYRLNVKFAREHDDPAQLVTEAGNVMASARAGTPLRRSAAACMRIAEAELRRRKGADAK